MYPNEMWPRLTVAGDVEELARVGAALVRDEAWRAVETHGVFRVVLAGGETPRALYARLADPSFRDVPWDLTQVFWGDERHVGPSDTESNYRMAFDTLLSRVPVNPSSVFRIRGEKPDAEVAARDYDATIRHVCGLDAGQWPRFDLVLLGLGTDGHTASLFPGSPALQERSRLVVAPWVSDRRAFRITMTLPVFDHALHVVFLVSGAAKAAAVAAAIQPPKDADPPPAALVRPTSGRLSWLLDAPAAQFVQSVS